MRIGFTRLAGGLAVLVHLALAPIARAGDQDAAAIARTGVELRRDHRNEEALAAFTKAYVLSPTPPIRAQLALAEQALARWPDAERDLDAALAADDPWIEKNRASLEEARGVVREHLAWLTVDVDVEKSVVRFDGEPLGRGAEARVVAGQGVLEVHAVGYVPDVRRLSLGAAEHIHQQITLAPLIAATPTEPTAPAPIPEIRSTEAPRRESSPLPAGPIVLGVAGLAGLSMGIYFGVRTLQDESGERANCHAGTCNSTAGTDYNDAKGNSTVSTAAFSAGIACLAGGAVWWLLGRAGARRVSGAVDIEPMVGIGAGGIVVRGRL